MSEDIKIKNNDTQEDEFALQPVIEGEIVEVGPMDIENLNAIYQKMFLFVQLQMHEGIDFGVIPGTKKRCLFKPGAEKLQRLFGFTASVKLSHSVEQWDVPVSESAFPLFHYRYTTSIYSPNGKLLSTCDGECNSYESKYRWRWVSLDKVPHKYDITKLETQPGTEREPAFAINKKETSGQYGKSAEYWKSWEEDIASGKAVKVKMKKKDGSDMDAWERGGALYRVPNEDICSQVNTIMKMAQKRSYVGDIIIAANASEYFTQDLEDNVKMDEVVPIKLLVPSKTAMAQKLVEYVTSCGIPDAGNWVKKVFDENGTVWSLDNWVQIIDLIEDNIAKK